MMNSVRMTLVKDLVEQGILYPPKDGNHGNIHPKRSDFTSEGIPFITAADLSGNIIDLVNCNFIPRSLADKLKKGFSIAGDVLLTHKATLGRCAIVPENEHPYVMLTPQVTFYRIKNNEALDGSFLKYYFLSPFFQKTLDNHGSSGSTRSYVGITAQLDLPIYLPDIYLQKAIAEVLSSLDDKIELLQKQNETLEALAQTLFRQWFIEEADDSWEEVPLTEIAHFLNGLACQKFPPLNELDKLPVLKIRELKDGISDSSDFATSTVDEKYLVNNGDVIFSWSASLVVKIWNGERCVLNQHLFKVTSEKYPRWFYYQWCKHHLSRFIAVANAHATTMGHIKRSDLNSAMVTVPSKNDLEIMMPIIEPLMEKISSNNNQIRILTETRDTLLPKLMSGTWRIQDLPKTNL